MQLISCSASDVGGTNVDVAIPADVDMDADTVQILAL